MNPSRDRIAQGRFFLRKAEEVDFSDRDAFRHFLEAAIVAARSVTNLLQKQYHSVYGFDEWYAGKQTALKSDPLARFLLEKRNFILKEGVAKIRKHIQVAIHETMYLADSVKVEIIRGSWKSWLRHLIQDFVYPLREKLAEMKEQRKRRRQVRRDNQVQITEAYYFTEPEWSSMPATELLKKQFDTLESIMNEATQKFGEPHLNTNGS
jgi:hypothetical protein